MISSLMPIIGRQLLNFSCQAKGLDFPLKHSKCFSSIYVFVTGSLCHPQHNSKVETVVTVSKRLLKKITSPIVIFLAYWSTIPTVKKSRLYLPVKPGTTNTNDLNGRNVKKMSKNCS